MPAIGNVPIQYHELPGGFRGTDETVKIMAKMAMGKWGARSPKIRALALNIINQAGIPEKDYRSEAFALARYVRTQIRYLKDPYGQETVSHPEETAFNTKAGDCLHEGTLLLTPSGYLHIKDIKKGDTIWGKDGWTKVTQTWDKGILPINEYQIDNGRSFFATGDHWCFLADGTEIRAKDLQLDAPLLTPSQISMSPTSAWLTSADAKFIGIFLADGWSDHTKGTLSISGKDGHPKELQKEWVKHYAELKGWSWSWQERSISLEPKKGEDSKVFSLLYDESGRHAPEKVIPKGIWCALNDELARDVVKGIFADSYDPEHVFNDHTQSRRARKGGLCFSTTSHQLALQVGTLLKVLGISSKDTLVVNHGGLGKNPVHRIYPRIHRAKVPKLFDVYDAQSAHVYDIETEDHGIYLPEADVTVHNCDDQSVLLAALLGSVGIPSRFKVIGTTPVQFSHVYLQANPGGGWITFDPIMANKPEGWEVPKTRRVIEKAYPTNGPDGWASTMQGINGGAAMAGLGYIADPRVESHLDNPTIPLRAGTGQLPGRAAGRPHYVIMPSGLDTDQGVDHMMAFPPNQNIPSRYPQQRAEQLRPELRRVGAPMLDVEEAGEEAVEQAMHGQFEVFGPDALADMNMGYLGAVNSEVATPHMQVPTVRQAPEGVDVQFSRAALVMDPAHGSKVLYHGMTNKQERPPIRPYTDVAGYETRDMLPGMGQFDGMAGPGMAADATGNEAQAAPMPEGAPEEEPLPNSMALPKKLLGLGALGIIAYMFMRRK